MAGESKRLKSFRGFPEVEIKVKETATPEELLYNLREELKKVPLAKLRSFFLNSFGSKTYKNATDLGDDLTSGLLNPNIEEKDKVKAVQLIPRDALTTYFINAGNLPVFKGGINLYPLLQKNIEATRASMAEAATDKVLERMSKSRETKSREAETLAELKQHTMTEVLVPGEELTFDVYLKGKKARHVTGHILSVSDDYNTIGLEVEASVSTQRFEKLTRKPGTFTWINNDNSSIYWVFTLEQ